MVVITIITIGLYVLHGHGRMLGVHSFGHTVPPGRGHIVPVGLITIPVGHTILGIPIIVPIIGMTMDIAGMTTTIITMAIPDTMDMITGTIITMPIITREHIAQVDPTRAGRQILAPVATTMEVRRDMPVALAVITATPVMAVTPDMAATPAAPLPVAPAAQALLQSIALPIIPSKALPSIAATPAVAATAVSELPDAKPPRAAIAMPLPPQAPRAMTA